MMSIFYSIELSTLVTSWTLAQIEVILSAHDETFMVLARDSLGMA